MDNDLLLKKIAGVKESIQKGRPIKEALKILEETVGHLDTEEFKNTTLSLRARLNELDKHFIEIGEDKTTERNRLNRAIIDTSSKVEEYLTSSKEGKTIGSLSREKTKKLGRKLILSTSFGVGMILLFGGLVTIVSFSKKLLLTGMVTQGIGLLIIFISFLIFMLPEKKSFT